MGLTYKILPHQRHVRIIGNGKIGTEECISVAKSVLNDPLCTPECTALIDLREATYEYRGCSEIVRLARVVEAFSAMLKSHIAIVARHSTLFSAEILCSHIRDSVNAPIKVFVEMSAAEQYCGKYAAIQESSGPFCSCNTGAFVSD